MGSARGQATRKERAAKVLFGRSALPVLRSVPLSPPGFRSHAGEQWSRVISAPPPQPSRACRVTGMFRSSEVVPAANRAT
jgi:hypothetical protein